MNAAVVILLQVILNVWMNKWLSHWLTIAVGFASELWMFIILIGFYTVGEITIDPTIDALVSKSVQEQYLGITYGLLGIAGLLGGVSGNSLAGQFLNVTTGNPQILWNVCVSIGSISIALIAIFLLFTRSKNAFTIVN